MFAAALAIAATTALARQPFNPSDDEPFTNAQVQSGVAATEADCGKTAGAVWARVGDEAECLRYWFAGFTDGKASAALVYFSGDLLNGNAVLDAEYPRRTPKTMQALVDTAATGHRVPYVFLARPGMWGSSGDHRQRRRALESKLVSAALDEIKARHGVATFHLSGLSGGGHVVASLLTLRTDIECAVMASAVSSPKMRWTMQGWPRDATGYSDSYEPVDHLPAPGSAHPNLRVFVVGDPKDSNVPWATQQPIAVKLRERGVPVEVLEGEGTGTQRHGLARSGTLVASQCMKGVPTPQILELARRGLKG